MVLQARQRTLWARRLYVLKYAGDNPTGEGEGGGDDTQLGHAKVVDQHVACFHLYLMV